MHLQTFCRDVCTILRIYSNEAGSGQTFAVERKRMGILNLFSKNLDDHHLAAPGRVKGPCATLLDRGIEPAGLKFTLDQDGFVTVSGRVRDESERDRILQVISGMPLVEGVKSKMMVEGTGPTAGPGAVNAGAADAGASVGSQPASKVEFSASGSPRVADNVFKQAG